MLLDRSVALDLRDFREHRHQLGVGLASMQSRQALAIHRLRHVIANIREAVEADPCAVLYVVRGNQVFNARAVIAICHLLHLVQHESRSAGPPGDYRYSGHNSIAYIDHCPEAGARGKMQSRQEGILSRHLVNTVSPEASSFELLKF